MQQKEAIFAKAPAAETAAVGRAKAPAPSKTARPAAEAPSPVEPSRAETDEAVSKAPAAEKAAVARAKGPAPTETAETAKEPTPTETAKLESAEAAEKSEHHNATSKTTSYIERSVAVDRPSSEAAPAGTASLPPPPPPPRGLKRGRAFSPTVAKTQNLQLALARAPPPPQPPHHHCQTHQP